MTTSQRLTPALAIVRRRWGSDAIRSAADLHAAGGTIATGFDALDALLTGGGIPRGRLTEIRSRTGNGAHSIAFSVLARAQAEANLVAYIDLSATFDPASALVHGIHLAHLLVIRPANATEALAILQALAAGGDVEAMVIGSLNRLAPDAAHARALDAAITNIVAPLMRSRCAVVGLTDEEEPAVRFLAARSALAHTAKLRLRVARAGWIEEHGVFGRRPRVTGARTEVAILAQPGQAAPRTVTVHIALPI